MTHTEQERELVRPDPWYIRLELANELEHLATAIRANPHGARFTMDAIADAFDECASRIRGQLCREADEEARQKEDAE